MNTLQLDLGERSYPIHIGANLLAQADLYKKHLKGSLTAVVTNETVAPLYADRVVKTLESLGQKVKLIVLPDGEVLDRKSTRLNSSHSQQSRMPSSA